MPKAADWGNEAQETERKPIYHGNTWQCLMSVHYFLAKHCK